MINIEQLSDPFLQALIRRVPKDQVVCHQGEVGSTMYYIVEGTMVILNFNGQKEKLVAIAGKGEVLGEKAILNEYSYQHKFTVQAKTDCVLLELDKKAIKMLLVWLPDFYLRLLDLMVNRLNQANQLIDLLQKPNPTDRLVSYLAYLDKYYWRKTPEDAAMGISEEELQAGCNVDGVWLQQVLVAMEDRGILVKNKFNYDLVSYEQLLEFS